jgi:hypothetical protein
MFMTHSGGGVGGVGGVGGGRVRCEGFFARAKRAKTNKASKFAREARIKSFASTFETCRSSNLCNYMIFYIIIGHRSNKIQSLLDIDHFFSFFFQKTQIYFYFLFFWRKKIEIILFWKKLSIKNWVDKFYPLPRAPLKWLTPPPPWKKSGANVWYHPLSLNHLIPRKNLQMIKPNRCWTSDALISDLLT